MNTTMLTKKLKQQTRHGQTPPRSGRVVSPVTTQILADSRVAPNVSATVATVNDQVQQLAQSLANQQSQNAQQAAVSIGSQEAGNQMAERGMAAKLDVMEREGEQASRDAEREKIETLLGMSQQRLGAANAARAAATKSIVGGVGNLVGAGASFLDAKGGMDAANMTPGGAG